MTAGFLPSDARGRSALPLPPTLACGAVAATLDLSIATAYWLPRGTPAARIPQSIAEWILGPAAYAMGAASVVAGLALYFGLMCGLAGFWRALAQRHPRLLRHPVRYGALYGAAAYLLLFGAIAPALVGRPLFGPPDWFAICLLAYMFAIGVPCALFARLPARGERGHWLHRMAS